MRGGSASGTRPIQSVCFCRYGFGEPCFNRDKDGRDGVAVRDFVIDSSQLRFHFSRERYGPPEASREGGAVLCLRQFDFIGLTHKAIPWFGILVPADIHNVSKQQCVDRLFFLRSVGNAGFADGKEPWENWRAGEN